MAVLSNRLVSVKQQLEEVGCTYTRTESIGDSQLSIKHLDQETNIFSFNQYSCLPAFISLTLYTCKPALKRIFIFHVYFQVYGDYQKVSTEIWTTYIQYCAQVLSKNSRRKSISTSK